MTNELQLMVEALEKKKVILADILQKSEMQSKVATAEKFEPEQFDALVDEKSELLVQMNAVDEGFDATYNRIKNELLQNKDAYKTEIGRMQQLIKDTLDLGAQIHATEARTKDSMSNALLTSRQELVKRRTTSKSVKDYYKANSQLTFMDAYFIDQKK